MQINTAGFYGKCINLEGSVKFTILYLDKGSAVLKS